MVDQGQPAVAGALRRISFALAVGVAAFGASILLDECIERGLPWSRPWTWLGQPCPLVPALSLTAAAGALALANGKPSLIGAYGRRVFAVLVVGINLVELLSYISLRHVPVGDLALLALTSLRPQAVTQAAPPPAFVVNTLLGASLFAIDAGPRWRLRASELLAAAAGLLALALVTAEALGTSGTIPGPKMDVPVAFALLSLALGVLLARPNEGAMALFTGSGSGGLLARRLLWGAVGLPVLTGLVIVAASWPLPPPPAAVAFLAVCSIAISVTAIGLAGRRLNATEAHHRQIESHLWASERKFRSLVESAPDAILAIDSSAQLVHVNTAAEQMFGYSRDALLGRPLAQLVPEPVLSAHIQHRARYHSANEHASSGVGFAVSGRRQDGSEFPVEIGLRRLFVERSEQPLFCAIVRDVTERRRAEETRARLASIVESSDDAIIGLSAEGIVTSWNRAAENIFGFSRAEVLNRPLHLCVVDEHHGAASDAFMRARAGERVGSFELLCRHKIGTCFDASLTVSPIENAAGRIIGISVIARDISQQKQAELELRRAHEAEKKLRAQLEAISHATVVITEATAALPQTDVDTTLKIVLEQARALTGARYAALGMVDDPEIPFSAWVSHGNLKAPFPSNEQRPLWGTSSEQSEVPTFMGVPISYRGKAIGTLYLANKAEGRFDVADRDAIELLATRIGTLFEIAKLYRRELTRKKWLQSVIDQMQAAVVIADAAGHIVSYNRAAQALSAGDTGLVDIHQNPILFDMRRPDGEAPGWEELPLGRAILHKEVGSSVELLAHTADGAIVPVLASATPVRDTDGRHVGTVGVFQNVALLKELERLREEWTAVIAHDLRHPVSIIALAAEFLSRAERTGSELKAIEHIRTGAARLGRMIDDLLDATRVEAKRLRLRRAELDLAELLVKVCEREESTLGSRPIHLQVDQPLPRVLADPVRLDQVLSNLLTNAAKYGDADTDVRVHTFYRGGEVHVAVTNSGPTLGEPERARLFDRFYRRGAGEGLGLGLYISKGLIEAHGGRIWVQSSEGLTTFWFTLPTSAEVAH